MDAFYIYENWVAHGHRTTIHRGSCGFCNNGVGIHGCKNKRCGTWLGPYNTLEEAEEAAKITGAEIRRCNCIRSK